MPESSDSLAERVVRALAGRGLAVTVAESCTGGLVSAAITSVPGASKVFGHGFITYSNAAKTELLGVPPFLIEAHGAVSAEVASAMATGALNAARADLAISITGVAGPDGGTMQKPVGLVFIAVAGGNAGPQVFENRFAGDRENIRHASVIRALELILENLT